MSYILNTTYNPYTFELMLLPFVMYKKEQDAQEEIISDLMTKAGITSSLIDKNKDAKTYLTYKSYMDSLQLYSDQIINNGLSLSGRRNLMNMKNKYSTVISPIQAAVAKKQEMIKEQREAKRTDNTVRFERDANDISLDEIIDNPYVTYGGQYSGKNFINSISQAVQHLSKSPNGKAILDKLNGIAYKYTYTLNYGATMNDINNALMNPSEKDSEMTKVLRNAIAGAVAETGILNWKNYNLILPSVMGNAYLGLLGAVGLAKLDVVTDDWGMKKAAAAASGGGKGLTDGISGVTLNPMALRVQSEISKALELIALYSKYFTVDKNGNPIMNDLGRREYFRQEPVRTMGSSSAGGPTGNIALKDSDFRIFMDSLGAKQFVKDNRITGPGRMANLFKLFVNDNLADAYDTYHTTEYDRLLDDSQQLGFMLQIRANAATKNGKQVLEAVELGKDRKWHTKEIINTEDLEDYVATNVRYYKDGATVILQKKNGSGEIYRVKLPAINKVMLDNVIEAANDASNMLIILLNGKRPKLNEEGRLLYDMDGNIIFTDEPQTPLDVYEFMRRQEEALANMLSYGSLFYIPSVTKKEEFNPLPQISNGW